MPATPPSPAPLLPALPAGAAARRTPRATWALGLCAALALGLMAAACLLALYLFFESGDRARLHAHLQQARAALDRVDDAATLSALPARLHDSFASLPDLAVRIQGPHGQTLYEQGSHAAMPPALLARPALAPPAPLVQWRTPQHSWRGSALVVRMPMDGAAPLTVAMALDVQRQHAFWLRLGWALGAYLLLVWALLAWLLRRAAR